MQGYWKRPDADEDVFFERDGRRCFRTGDIAAYDEEGYFFMVDPAQAHDQRERLQGLARGGREHAV